jgi:hypothetical protein
VPEETTETKRQTVYVAMIHDRHFDPTPRVFSTSTAAIEFAREWASDHVANGEPVEADVDGWLYSATYSSEQDSVWVLMCEVDEP